MKKEQALQVIKQALDAGIKIGICQNIDSAALISQAWSVIIQEFQKIGE